MKTVTFEVLPPDAAMAGFAKAWTSGKADKSARIAFASPELLWEVLTAKRWELIKGSLPLPGYSHSPACFAPWSRSFSAADFARESHPQLALLAAG